MCKIEKRDGHGKLRNDHGKVMEQYVVKSVGTLDRSYFEFLKKKKRGQPVLTIYKYIACRQ